MDEDNVALDFKIKEYKVAIEKYKNIIWYTRIELLFSIVIVIFQITMTIQLFQQYNSNSIIFIIITLFISYVAADFINGLTHMIVDNNTNYASIYGPFVATFHLHHAKLVYKNNHPLKIYFYESGHKIWLVFYFLIFFIVQSCVNLNFYLDLFLVSLGILSSIAELSHFWCHNFSETNGVIRLLQKYKLLLSMKHHRFHHSRDNINYAFLNGMTDPLLNIIASYFYKGYKNYADRHVADYEPSQK